MLDVCGGGLCSTSSCTIIEYGFRRLLCLLVSFTVSTRYGYRNSKRSPLLSDFTNIMLRGFTSIVCANLNFVSLFLFFWFYIDCGCGGQINSKRPRTECFAQIIPSLLITFNTSYFVNSGCTMYVLACVLYCVDNLDLAAIKIM